MSVEFKIIIDEEIHIQKMIEKWGVHCWYNKVNNTKDDCDIAKMIRYEEEYIQFCKINNISNNEIKLDFEREKIFRRVEREKYITDKTSIMTQHKKEKWITNFEIKEGEHRVNLNNYYINYDDYLCEEQEQ